MLHAIHRGKAGTIDFELRDAKISWRTLYKDREDLLTAAVISRLAYLSGDEAWQLLSSESIGTEMPQSPLGEFMGEIELWPRLSLESGTVEPDAIVRFKHATILIEAKRRDEDGHTAQQWAREWAAFHKEDLHDPERRPCYLFALGGFRNVTPHSTRRVAEAAQVALQADYPDFPPIRVIACSWYGFLASVLNCRAAWSSIGADRGTMRILDDLLLALDLHGVRRKSWLREMTEMDSVRINFEAHGDCVRLGLPPDTSRRWLSDLSQDVAQLLPVQEGIRWLQ